MNGDGVHWGKAEGGCQKRATLSLMKAVDQARRVRVQVAKRPFRVIASQAGVDWPGLVEVPFREFNSPAAALVLYKGAAALEPLAHDDCGEVFLPMEKSFPACRG